MLVSQRQQRQHGHLNAGAFDVRRRLGHASPTGKYEYFYVVYDKRSSKSEDDVPRQNFNAKCDLQKCDLPRNPFQALRW